MNDESRPKAAHESATTDLTVTRGLPSDEQELLRQYRRAVGLGYRVHTCRIYWDKADGKKKVANPPPKDWHEQPQETDADVIVRIKQLCNAYLIHCPTSGVTLHDGDTPEECMRIREATGIKPHVTSGQGGEHTYTRGVVENNPDLKTMKTAFGPGSFYDKPDGRCRYIGELPEISTLPETPVTSFPSWGKKSERAVDDVFADWTGRDTGDVCAELNDIILTGNWDRDRLLSGSAHLAGKFSPQEAQRRWDELFERNGVEQDDDDRKHISTAIEKYGAEQDTPADSFWTATPVLNEIRQWAHARLVPPWTLLGCILVRLAAEIPPSVVLPPIVSTRGSLNLIVALVGPSGSGKDGSLALSDECIKFERIGAFDTPPEICGLGSGEGVAAAYVHRPTSGDQKGEIVQHATAAIFTAMEIETADALMQRSGATIGSVIREAWSGSRLGFQNAAKDRRLPVAAHSYRFTLLLGVQPGKAEKLLAGQDAGTPQRVLWMPIGDTGFDRNALAPVPSIIEWRRLTWPHGHNEITVCDTARKEIHSAAMERYESGKGDDYAHTRLTRLKVAALLAFLHGEHAITDQWWSLSGVIARVSDRTREKLQALGKEEKRKSAIAAGTYQAIREGSADATKLRALEDWALGKLPDWTAGATVRKQLDSKRRGDLSAVLEDLVSRGLIESREVTGGGQPGHEYRKR